MNRITQYVVFCLASFTEIRVLEVPCSSRYQNSIPFCGQIILQYMNILQLFIHFSADGNFGCFLSLAMMNNVSRNIHV